MASAELIKSVQDYALENYEKGWDVVAETYTAEEIGRELDKHNITGSQYALAHFQKWVVDLWKEQLSNTRFDDTGDFS